MANVKGYFVTKDRMELLLAIQRKNCQQAFAKSYMKIEAERAADIYSAKLPELPEMLNISQQEDVLRMQLADEPKICSHEQLKGRVEGFLYLLKKLIR